MIGPIVDFGPWLRIAALIETYESTDAFDQVAIDGGVEFVKIGDLTLARWVRRGDDLRDTTRWRSMRETCEAFGISSRAVAQRIERGEMKKRYVGGIVEVAVVRDTWKHEAPDTITSLPDWFTPSPVED